MTGLFDIPSYGLSGLALLLALACMGFVVGTLTGLFGVGGAFVITPLMNVLLGVPYTMATGCSMSFTLGTSATGWSRHARMGNVASKTMLILVGAAICGTVLGADLHIWLRGWLAPCGQAGHGGRDAFTLTMHGLFMATLGLTAWLVISRPAHERTGKSLLQRVPLGPRIEIRIAKLSGVSLPGLVAVGVGIGFFKGLLGIGGGVLFVPVMLMVVGLSMHQSIGTSLGVVLFSSVAGTIFYGGGGHANLWIVMSLLVGSTLGVQLGAYLCSRLHAARIQRYFAVFIVMVIAVLAWDFARKLAC